jgi:acyl-CoA thioesterase FadM
MVADLHEFPLRIPRQAFSLRGAARAGDVWRAFQEVALEGSTRAGWPPQRYRQGDTAFVVRSMIVVHHVEATYGEELSACTWIRRMRRGTLCTRELRLESERGPSATGTQEWVHVGPERKPMRARPELVAAFPERDDGTTAVLPAWDEATGPTQRFDFDVWYTWMDPLDHVNHPAYVDFCDEATSRVLVAAGVPALYLAPVAEKLTFRSGAVAGERLVVSTTPCGVIASDILVLRHELCVGDRICADGVTLRRLVDAPAGALRRAFDVSVGSRVGEAGTA